MLNNKLLVTVAPFRKLTNIQYNIVFFHFIKKIK